MIPQTIAGAFAYARLTDRPVTCGRCGAVLATPESVVPHFLARHGWRAVYGEN